MLNKLLIVIRSRTKQDYLQHNNAITTNCLPIILFIQILISNPYNEFVKKLGDTNQNK